MVQAMELGVGTNSSFICETMGIRWQDLTILDLSPVDPNSISSFEYYDKPLMNIVT